MIFLSQRAGCWIIYKLLDEKMYELEGYELMSANDAPERDPFDWYNLFPESVHSDSE